MTLHPLHTRDTPTHDATDESLLARVRAGDSSAYGELWGRHSAAGLRAARSITDKIEAEDLVSEAYARILAAVSRGNGPDGAFRPYLYTVIRHLAAAWGSQNTTVHLDDDFDVPDTIATTDPVIDSLNRSLVAQAFRALPERWQTVLWYTTVEQMDPQDVAPLMGISPNGIAALAYRARAGLRRSWVDAHLAREPRSDLCRWTLRHLQDAQNGTLASRKSRKVANHLASCTSCSQDSQEISMLLSQLGAALLPTILGGAYAASRFLGSDLSDLLVGNPPVPIVADPVSGSSVASLAGTTANTSATGAPSLAGALGSGTGAAGAGAISAGTIGSIAASVAAVFAVGLASTGILASGPPPAAVAMAQPSHSATIPSPSTVPPTPPRITAVDLPADPEKAGDSSRLSRSDRDVSGRNQAVALKTAEPLADTLKAPSATEPAPGTPAEPGRTPSAPVAPSPAPDPTTEPTAPAEPEPGPDVEAPAAPSVFSESLQGATSSPVLSGTGESGATVAVSFGGTEITTTTVGDDGHWSASSLPGLSPLIHAEELTVTQRDVAGNESEPWTNTEDWYLTPSIGTSSLGKSHVKITIHGWPGASWSAASRPWGVLTDTGVFDASGTATIKVSAILLLPSVTYDYVLSYVRGDLQGPEALGTLSR